MRRVFLFVALMSAALLAERRAQARPPADGYLDPQKPGARLVLTPFFGPGFRAAYDQRIEIERQMSELRLQVTGTVALPFAEASASVDARFFLMSFGATGGYHDEWRVLRFEPDPLTGRDRAGQGPSPEPPASTLPPGTTPLPPNRDPAIVFTDLDRIARAFKDQNGDVGHAEWPFFEGRWSFYWPAYGFTGVSTLTARYDARPDVSFDWELGTVQSHGLSYRWDGYFLFRERNLGFAGPALQAVYVPRQRVVGAPTIGDFLVVVPEGSACQMNEGVPCRRRYEAELHYGFVAGLQPGWGGGTDTLLVRAYAAWGLDEGRLFGTHAFHQPLEILVAYIANIELSGGGS
ncbi:MAG TPA: hypothetical protein VHC69_28315 [Polyangiaceae bacterium]|nr:hypothetical protein [Polyangiaceae bacterium]